MTVIHKDDTTIVNSDKDYYNNNIVKFMKVLEHFIIIITALLTKSHASSRALHLKPQHTRRLRCLSKTVTKNSEREMTILLKAQAEAGTPLGSDR